jgi:hypothetical protein
MSIANKEKASETKMEEILEREIITRKSNGKREIIN